MKKFLLWLFLLGNLQFLAQAEHVIELSTATGNFTKVCYPIPNVTWVAPYCNTYNQNQGIYYFTSSSPCNCLVGVNVLLGQTVTSATFLHQLMGYKYDNTTNKMYGFKMESANNLKRFGLIDPSTTSFTALGAPFSNPSLYQGGFYAFDRVMGRYMFLDPPKQLYTLDAATGSVISSPTLISTSQQNVFGFAYNNVDGTLYGYMHDNNLNAGFLVSLDLATGGVWKIGPATNYTLNGGSGTINESKGEYILMSDVIGWSQITVLDLDSGYVKDVSLVSPLSIPSENVWGVEYDNIRQRLFSMHWSMSFELIGVPQQTSANERLLFPNPASNMVNFSTQLLDKPCTAIVRDPLGKIILEQNFEAGAEPKLSRDGLPAGVYYCEIKTVGQSSRTYKLVFE